MQNNRELIEVIIRTYNGYVTINAKQAYYGTDEKISFSQIQVIETLLRNNETKMTDIASELGITKGTLTKNINKLELKGLVSRYKLAGNKKTVYLNVTEKGKTIYSQYQKYIFNELFSKVFSVVEQFDDKHRKLLEDFYDVIDKFIGSVNCN